MAEQPPTPAPSAPGGARFCANCGAPLAPEGRFCGACGAPVAGGPPPPGMPAGPVDPGRPPPVSGMHPSVRLSGAGKRLGGHLLEALLVLVTLGIGWLIWSLIVWERGQTPAKQLLGMRVINSTTGHRAGWGRMALREFPVKWLISLVAIATVIGLVLYFWLLWDDRRQELWDKVCDTLVVDDPMKVFA